ncbi:outer membrane lipoprotein carrier protein [Colwellia chukchiensis]|uniref:Outer-membrane lipoprotein carrier protein n=1 Tax=Colwellia chukchiensis TaxID=641665 RepID=A0A1H7MWC8_9GAMM|nr:outer membrane lipoprotein chaperone LolA [Colwellia chukchiensis]SEL15339.1 outer membrane lipoprotein carrier protein [Colwellia chukchiensis]
MKLFKNVSLLATLISLALSANSVAQTPSAEPASSTQGLSTAQPLIDAKIELMVKLEKVAFFSADFNQQIFDQEGNSLQQGTGKFSVSKPNLIHWQTLSPDESLIVSDGENLWFYDPFVEQVSVYTLASAIANTPILLLSSNDPQLWQDYAVSKIAKNRYAIVAKGQDSRVKSLTLSFANSEHTPKLIAVEMLDTTGQLSVIKLLNHGSAPNPALFSFSVPEGVYLDDQR